MEHAKGIESKVVISKSAFLELVEFVDGFDFKTIEIVQFGDSASFCLFDSDGEIVLVHPRHLSLFAP